MVFGVHRRRCAGARKLCQPDSHQRRRHARKRLARRFVQRGEKLYRFARFATQGCQAVARRRVCTRQFCTECQGAGPAVSRANQRASQFTRRGAFGVELCASGPRPVVEPACGLRQKTRRVGDPCGAVAPKSRSKSGKAQRLWRGRVARQTHRLRKPRFGAQRNIFGRRRQRGRQRQNGPRQRVASHIAFARQGAQHLGGRARPLVRQQRGPRHRCGHRCGPARPERHA